MGKKMIMLDEPIEICGQTVSEIEMRRPTIGDLEDAQQEAIRHKRVQNAITMEMCLITRVTKINYDKLRQMYQPDYLKLRDALNELNGVTKKDDDAGDGENPMI